MKVFNEKTGMYEQLDLSQLNDLMVFPVSTHPVPFKVKDHPAQATQHTREIPLHPSMPLVKLRAM